MSAKDLQDKFFSDPSWKEVEDMILAHINPLIDMSMIDTTQPAEHVKAEIMGRTLAYNGLVEFLNDTKLVTRKINTITTFK